jgi:hypothetical protein
MLLLLRLPVLRQLLQTVVLLLGRSRFKLLMPYLFESMVHQIHANIYQRSWALHQGVLYQLSLRQLGLCHDC